VAFDPLQTSFNGGEVSHRLRGQVQLDLYKKALAYCSNWECTPQGSLLKRQGSKFIAPAWPGVVRSLPVAGKQGYLIAFGDPVYDQGFVSCFNADGLYSRAGLALAQDPSGFGGVAQTSYELVANGDMSSGGTGWTEVAGDTDFTLHSWWGGYGSNPRWGWTPEHVAAAPVGGATIRQAVTAVEPGTHTFRFSLLTTHSGGVPDVQVAALADDCVCTVKVGTTAGGAELYSLVITASVHPWNGKKDAHYCVDVPVAAAGTVYIEFGFTTYGSVSGVSLLSPSGSDSLATPWTAAQLHEVQVVPLVERLGLVVTHPDVAPWLIELDEYGKWHAGAITFTSTPVEWAEGNYPGVCEVFQGRLWLSGCRNNPDRIWATRIGKRDARWDERVEQGPFDPFDLTTTTSVTDDADVTTTTSLVTDGIDARLAAKAGIRWMRGYQNILLVGTEVGEYSVGAQAGVISTLDFQVRDESAYGASAQPALLVGSQAIYTSRDTRKVRAVNFTNERQSWLSDDISFVGEHLTAALVAELVHARDPDDTLVARLADGTLACCTYVANRQTAAWWRLALGGSAVVESVCTTEGTTSLVWCVVRRGATYYLEALAFADQSGSNYLDCWVAGLVTVSTHSCDGVPYPDGAVLSAMTSGLLRQTNAGATGGKVVLSAGFSTPVPFVVGFAYQSKATTLPLDGGMQRGTSQGSKRRWPKVRLRLDDSALPVIGPAAQTGELPAGTASTRVTKDVVVNTLGFEEQGALDIIQDLPYRTEVLALFGVAQANEV
jgi:hypothetical protein